MKDAPRLSPDGKAVLSARIGVAMTAADHANTEWLRGIVVNEGWPKISAVGQPASDAAWLLVQHADADPAFQLQALRLMEPLLASGEINPRNYAYLYDRVMLKLTGKQRYATQFTCKSGKRVPQPLEQEEAVDRLRAQAKLEPYRGALARMDQTYGACARS